jgi:predicted Zn-dependent protease
MKSSVGFSVVLGEGRASFAVDSEKLTREDVADLFDMLEVAKRTLTRAVLAQEVAPEPEKP